MQKLLTLQNLGIAIAVKNYNCSILTYDFLKYGNIVPLDWELAREPVVSNQGSQVIFRNGVSITAQQGMLSFLEVIGSKDIAEIQIPAIAHRYIQALPNSDYQGLGIDLRGYITETQADTEGNIQKYLQSLLAPAPWQEVGNDPVQVSLQLGFTLEQGQLNLNINEGKLYITEEETVPIVLFSGNFSYGITGNNKEEQLQSLHQLIDNWQPALETYQDIINTKFLQSRIVVQDAPQSETDSSDLLISQS
ncbi:hypothetical protein [Nostoc parmelioides]|uniref:Uncharacterized protein n=1 Tax=Nostoc parmelioides FACHB-3921 TaxID=2692909 RepID=A0ABR8BEV5_9NOSO|nr:hypothetical protein [Nostoc parmelioides]MBD2252346.1 hypothetical protein [Nostoc parmelioides FACHB-3921]